MPTVTINGKACEFTEGQMILQVANEQGIEIPQYCFHDGLSRPAQCRICLAECWAPNPRNDNKLEPFMGGKLLPTCTTPASDGMVVHTDSPKAVANQKAVMEYLLINHPLDCPVCDQAGECFLQDYSYKYGRSTSRFEETKVKQPKKDLGPHVYLYADRCIMCTRCVRFDREVAGADQIMIGGRGNKSEIDVFPGVALDNELSANVIDLCPVGALLDKDFLFTQRVWFLRSTPSIDPITASGDNILVEHNEGKIYRVKPRENASVNHWWITDEVRYGWKFVHAENRLRSPMHRRFGALDECDFNRAYDDAIDGIRKNTEGKRLALLVSPMLPCEEAYALATLAREIDPDALIGVGPVPVQGEDKVFPPAASREDGFVMYAEKAPNARGVRRVLRGVTGSDPLEFNDWLGKLGGAGAAIVTGNYPSQWASDELIDALGSTFTVLIDTLGSALIESADVVLPGATFAEKAGTFENARGMIQAFEQAIPLIELAKSEGQIAFDLLAEFRGTETKGPDIEDLVIVDEQPGQVPAARTTQRPRAELFNAGTIRARMSEQHPELGVFVTEVAMPKVDVRQRADVEVVEL